MVVSKVPNNTLIFIRTLFKTWFQRQTPHVPNLMLMSKLYCSTSFALDSAREKLGV